MKFHFFRRATYVCLILSFLCYFPHGLHAAVGDKFDTTHTRILFLKAMHDKSDLNNVYKDSTTLLHRACACGLVDMARTLIQRGARINCLDDRREMPIHKAARNGHKEMVNKLLLWGSNYVAKNSRGFTPAMLADKQGFRSIGDLIQDHHQKNRQKYKNVNSAKLHAVAVQAICLGELKMRGTQYEGQGKVWPFVLQLTEFCPVTYWFKGRLKWTTLKATHVVEGVWNQNSLVFRETDFLEKGEAVIDTKYRFDLRAEINPAQHKVEGLWSLKGQKGKVVIDLTGGQPSFEKHLSTRH